MTPRLAQDHDVPRLVALGAKFHAMAPHDVGEYEPTAVANLLRFLIGNEAGLLVTNDEGMIGGMMAPVFFSPTKMMMEESFWWADRGGKDLLRSFITHSKEMGADFILISTLENERSDVASRVVTRMGFEPVERRFIKEL